MFKLKFIWLIVIALGFLMIPYKISANEGNFSLKNNYVDCEGISIWLDNAYEISGKCSGLVYPYHEQLSHYILWIQSDSGGKPIRISGIDQGVFNGTSSVRFTGMFVTVETESVPNNPGSTVIVSGNLSLFNFPLPYQGQNNQTVTPNQNVPVVGVTLIPTPSTATSSGKFDISRFAVLPLVLIGFIVLVIIAIIYRFR